MNMTRIQIQPSRRWMTAQGVIAGGLLLGWVAAAGVASATPAVQTTDPGKPRVEEFASGSITVALVMDPPVVRLDRDTLLTIRLTAPTNLLVTLPRVDARIKGFAVSGSYDSPPEIQIGSLRQERHVRLTPQIAPLYRIGPLPIVSKAGGTEQWFPTRPIVLEAEPIVKGLPGKDLAGLRGPVPIRPGFKTLAGYLLALVALGVIAYGIWWAARRVHREVTLRRMSPRERALHELAELLARDLVGHQRVKDFYFELTMIVRAYIERAHAIRAPEQTTEEFLLAVSRDPRFSHDVVTRLRTFMQAADMVKYAAHRPDEPAVSQALSTARTYIETDAEDKVTP